MSVPSEWINITFIWHSLIDACRKCQALNGREFHNQDLFQSVLWDHIYGNVWDLNTNQTLAHPHCRCWVEIQVTFNPEKLRLFEDLRLMFLLYGKEMELPLSVTEDIGRLRNELDALQKLIGETEVKAKESLPTLREERLILNTILNLMQMATGDKNIDRGIAVFQRLLMILYSVNIMMGSVEAGMGPIGWAMLLARGANVAMASYSTVTQMMDIRSEGY